MLVSDEAGEEGALPHSWQVQGFLPGGHQILLYREAELGLFDADSHGLRRIPLEEARKHLFIRWTELSPAGGFALVNLEQAPGVPFDRNEVVGPGYVVVDLKRGASVRIVNINCYGSRPQWVGEDRLLFQDHENKFRPWRHQPRRHRRAAAAGEMKFRRRPWTTR